MAKKKTEQVYARQKKINSWLIIAIVEAVLLLMLIIVLFVPSKTGEAYSNLRSCRCVDPYTSECDCSDPANDPCPPHINCENGCDFITGKCYTTGYSRCFGRVCFR